jgi:HD superfamily phosphohydrolase
MYWQVYLHKTVIAAEQMLVKILERAKELSIDGRNLFATPSFSYFLKNSISREEFNKDPRNLESFTKLDDNDIFTSIKVWVDDEDLILSTLCKHLISRNLYKVEMSNEPPSIEWTSYFVSTDTIKNSAYNFGDGSINILMKDGSIQDITKASDNSNLEALAKTVQKYIICYVKEVRDVH